MSTPVGDDQQQRIALNVLPEYEMKLLSALAFFLNRNLSSQATAALCMYLRQSHDRILTQCDYYAHQLDLNRWEVLDLIHKDPDQARAIFEGRRGELHHNETDAFSEDTSRSPL